MLGRYLESLGVERGLSRNTLAAYGADLERLGAALEEAGETDLLSARQEAIAAHLRELRRRGISPRSIARALVSIRSFYAHLAEAGERTDNPAANLLPPKLWRKLPHALSEPQVEALLAVPDVSTPLGMRDRAMLELLYATGLRVSELVGLRLPQLRLEVGFLVAFGKGQKERIVPVGEQAEAWLAALSRRGAARHWARPARGACFVNRRGDPMTRQGFWKILKAYGRGGGDRAPDLAARPAPQLRHPPARARRRPARGAGDARPRRHLDDRDLHPRPPGTAARVVRQTSPARLGHRLGASVLDSSIRSTQKLRPDWVGISLVAAGVAVLLGWWLHLPRLVQVLSSSSPMQPMTAVSFVLLGGALILLQRGASRSARVARILLVLVAMASVAVLVQYVLGVDLGIDRLFGATYLMAHTVIPGRMAPNTAVSLLALAISYLLLAGPRDTRRAVAAATLSSIALAVAGTALIGYLSDLQRAYTWGSYTRMAVATAVALGMAAVVALRTARRIARRAGGRGTGFAPWLALVTGLAMTVFAVRAVSSFRPTETLAPEIARRERSEAWLMLLSGGVVSILWAFAVRRGDALKHRGEALEAALGELQQTQQQIERQRADVARTHAVLEAVLSGTHDVVFAKDLEGRYLFLNESCARVLGLTVADVVGRTDEQIVPPEAAAAFRASDRAALAAGIVQTSEDRSVLNGRAVVYLVAKGVLRDPGGNPFGTFGIARDISERKEREDSLRSSQEKARRLSVELLRSNHDLERFAYVASHDLQEPLRMVKSYVQLLDKRYGAQLDATAREFIAYAVDGAQRMERMIIDLLAFSRVDRKGARMEPVPLGEPLATALANLRMASEESGAVIEQGTLPTVLADRAQMAMLLQNLVGNALKFRRRDRPPRIEIAALPRDDDWEITVADDGPGIAPANLERIFDVFVRLDPRRDVPGTGIGLALCRRIAERHGGRIWAESPAGGGAVFHVLLPGAPQTPAGLGEATSNPV